MAGEHIALLRLLRLKDAIGATITSKEFLDLKVFKIQCAVLMTDNFWKYLYVMCHALYAPMRVLRLADQKIPAMDKLYYFVLQSDKMLCTWIEDAERKAATLLTKETVSCMLANVSVTIDKVDMSDNESIDINADGYDVSSSDGDEGDEDSVSSTTDITGCVIFGVLFNCLLPILPY